MLAVALTGGIGAGKSTVASLFREFGAVTLEADQLARLVVEPGGGAYDEVVRLFPGAPRSSDGSFDRAWLAVKVFSDSPALAALEGAIHPVVRAGIDDALARLRSSNELVIVELPLLIERDRRPELDGVIVVDLSEEEAIERLVTLRGMTEYDARARIANQPTRAQRLRIADWVIDNSGSPQDLRRAVSGLWDVLRARPGPSR